MKPSRTKKLGATLVVVTCIAYVAYRAFSIASNFSIINLIVGLCEFSLAAVVCVEAVLLIQTTSNQHRKQDENVLIESAKNVLFSSSSNPSAQSAQNGDTKIESATMTASGSYPQSTYDVIVFAEQATLQQLRRCLLSLSIAEGIDEVYVVDPTLSEDRSKLAKEFNNHVVADFNNIVATTNEVLVCRGKDILYPDVCGVARSYEINEGTFLELRTVYSDEKALGPNGLVEVSNKRKMVRDALSTRGLATWSTGPAFVPSNIFAKVKEVKSASTFFRSCEANSIHGLITEEIAAEEITVEQTISEVQWRAGDLAYTSKAYKNSYKAKGSKAVGTFIKAWSLFTNISVVRRFLVIALTLGFVLSPSSYGFVTSSYLLIAAGVIAVSYAGGYLVGDERGPLARVREFYFDIEAVMYNGYESLISNDTKYTDKSIVKKLPTVSVLLIITDIALIYRVISQYTADVSSAAMSTFLKYTSLFSGYLLLVTMLVGLGMVIVRQSRTSQRREISRGANINLEPVSMIDLSPGGAGCISVTELVLDSEVEFESSLPIKAKNKKFKCKGVVRSCVQWNESYRIGVEFVDLDQEQKDILETYCSIIFPHEQARQASQDTEQTVKITKVNGKAEKRFLSYAATFVALGAIIFSNLSNWW